MEHKWHPDCFVCVTCSSKFKVASGKIEFFYNWDGLQICGNCANTLSEPCGGGCGENITPRTEGGFITALDKKWHQQCFVCNACRANFTDGQFKLSDARPGIPYCDQCIGFFLSTDEESTVPDDLVAPTPTE